MTMTPHEHQPVLTLYAARECSTCGSPATYQRICSICKTTYCEICQVEGYGDAARIRRYGAKI